MNTIPTELACRRDRDQRSAQAGRMRSQGKDRRSAALRHRDIGLGSEPDLCVWILEEFVRGRGVIPRPLLGQMWQAVPRLNICPF